MVADARVRLLIRQAMHVPSPDDSWLSAAERAEHARFRIDKRKGEWRLGRWTAKHLAAMECGLDNGSASLARIEIRPAADGAPEIFFEGRRLDLALSISHSTGVAACAVTPGPTPLGCNVELIRALRHGTVARHYTAAEQALLDGLDPHDWAVRGTLIWTAKESALKALREGLRIDTRLVEAVPVFKEQPGPWHPLTVNHLPDGRTFRGGWRRIGDHILSVVAEPAAALPLDWNGGSIGP